MIGVKREFASAVGEMIGSYFVIKMYVYITLGLTSLEMCPTMHH